MNRKIVLIALALAFAIPTALSPHDKRTVGQALDPNHGTIVRFDSSRWNSLAQNHLDQRCGEYFIVERDGSLRFVLSAYDTKRKETVTRLALAKRESLAIEVVKKTAIPAVSISAPRQYAVVLSRKDSAESPCLW